MMGLDFIDNKRNRHRRCESKALREARNETLFDRAIRYRRTIRARILIAPDRLIATTRCLVRQQLDGSLLVYSGHEPVAEVVAVPDDLRQRLTSRPEGIASVALGSVYPISETVEIVFDERS